MLNFKHLHYFWMVAKQGSVVKASESLHVTPQTISGQIQHLEQSFGQALFEKAGRGLQLTDAGKLVLSYADDIFALGDELEDRMQHADVDAPVVLRIGITDSVPKTIASRILQPALNMHERVRLVCRESSQENLLAEMALHKLDMVLADGPIPSNLGIRGYNHKLGSSSVSFLAARTLADTLEDDFPICLDGQSILIPSEGSQIHMPLLHWFQTQHVTPRITGEFDDSALMKAFGRDGAGIFVVPSAISDDVCEQFDAKELGRTEALNESFYVIANDRHLSNPAIEFIVDKARTWLENT